MSKTTADIILHPARMRILSTLAGRQLTAQQIGLALPEVAQATLYRHLSRLVQAGVIAVTQQRPVRGVLEKVYALAEGSTSILLDPHQLTREDWERGFAAYTASLLGQFTAYLRQEGADPLADGVSFRTGFMHLSDAELAQLRDDLQAAAAPYRAYGSSPERRRRVLSSVLMPDVLMPDVMVENGEPE